MARPTQVRLLVPLAALAALLLASPVDAQTSLPTERGDVKEPRGLEKAEPGHRSYQQKKDEDAIEEARKEITDRELRMHAQAIAALERKEPDLLVELRRSTRPTVDFKGEKRARVNAALEEVGVDFRDFVQMERVIKAEPRVQRRFEAVARDTAGETPAARSGAQQSGASKPAPASK